MAGWLLLDAGSGASEPVLDLGPIPEVEQTTVIELQHRPAEEVLPALQPHLAGRPVSVSVSGNRLLLHGPTRDLGVLIDLVAAIDHPVAMLWVTVTQDRGGHPAPADPDPETPADRATEANWSETRFGTRSWRDPAEEGYAVTRRWATRRNDATRVLVREGDWASLEVRALPPDAGLAAQVQATPWVEVYVSELARPGTLGSGSIREGGLRVRPRLTGERVTLELELYGVLPYPRSGEPLEQARRTVLSGRIGEWIPLGGQVELDLAGATDGLIARTRPAGLPDLLIRVTAATAPEP